MLGHQDVSELVGSQSYRCATLRRLGVARRQWKRDDSVMVPQVCGIGARVDQSPVFAPPVAELRRGKPLTIHRRAPSYAKASEGRRARSRARAPFGGQCGGREGAVT